VPQVPTEDEPRCNGGGEPRCEEQNEGEKLVQHHDDVSYPKIAERFNEK
jgi:hypothetical protein